jgi:ribonuclease BN (tRNA processing enzyme)
MCARRNKAELRVQAVNRVMAHDFLERGMKIAILGTRGEIKQSTAYHARHSGVLIDDSLLCDLGQPEFLNYHPSHIFITHLHPDHAFFVRNTQVAAVIPVPIFAPETYKDMPISVLSSEYSVGPYTITPIPTLHSTKVKSQGYIIQKGAQKILYSGDMLWIEKRYWSKLNNLDLVITEASFIREGGVIRHSRRDHKISVPYGHAGVPNLVRFFKQFTSTILFMHFGSWFYELGAQKARSKLKKLGRDNGVEVIVGHDGKILFL